MCEEMKPQIHKNEFDSSSNNWSELVISSSITLASSSLVAYFSQKDIDEDIL